MIENISPINYYSTACIVNTCDHDYTSISVYWGTINRRRVHPSRVITINKGAGMPVTCEDRRTVLWIGTLRSGAQKWIAWWGAFGLAAHNFGCAADPTGRNSHSRSQPGDPTWPAIMLLAAVTATLGLLSNMPLILFWPIWSFFSTCARVVPKSHVVPVSALDILNNFCIRCICSVYRISTYSKGVIRYRSQGPILVMCKSTSQPDRQLSYRNFAPT